MRYDKIVNADSTVSYVLNNKNNKRRVYKDVDSNGKSHFMTYFQDDDKDKPETIKYDINSDGQIDRAQRFTYDENGNLASRYTDIDNDGKWDQCDDFDEEGKIKSKRYYEYNDKKHTKITYADKNNDGKIDSVGYFRTDKNGKLQTAQHDLNNDGIIDNKYVYDKDGNKTERYIDSDSDGKWNKYERLNKNGEITSTHRYEYGNSAKGPIKTTYADKDNDGNIDSVCRFKYDQNNGQLDYAEHDYDNDGNIDKKLMYSRWGHMAGEYTDTDDDGKFDRYDQYDKNHKLKATNDFNDHTRTVYNDDGSVIYYQDDKEGRCQSAQYDLDNDGKIDRRESFAYSKLEGKTDKLVSRYIDGDNDGQYEECEQYGSEGTIKGLLDIAKMEIGQAEETGHEDGVATDKYSNRQKAQYYWCANFASWCLENGLGENNPITRDSFCEGIKKQAEEQGFWAKQGSSYTPKSGDLIIFDWDRNGKANHIGIVEKVENGKVHTIEGNSDSSVRREEYDYESKDIMGYCKIREAQKLKGIQQ